MTVTIEAKDILDILAEVEMMKDATLTRYRNSITREAYIKDVDRAVRLIDKLLSKENVE